MRCPVVVDLPESTWPITTLKMSQKDSNIEKAMKTKMGYIHIDVGLLFTHVERLFRDELRRWMCNLLEGWRFWRVWEGWI